MKQRQRALFLSTMLMAGLLIFSCTQREKQTTSGAIGKQEGAADVASQNGVELQTKALHVEEMQAKAEAMLKSLREKETLLQAKQAELDSLQNQLLEKELELQQREDEASRLQRSGMVLLIVGFLLMLISTVLLIFRKKGKSKKSETPATSDLKGKDSKIVAPKSATLDSPTPAKSTQKVSSSKKKTGDKAAEKEPPQKASPRTRKTAAAKKTEPATQNSPKKTQTRKRSTAAKPKTQSKKEPSVTPATNEDNKTKDAKK